MANRYNAFGLVDLAGLIVIAAGVLAIGLPSAGRAREMSKRSVCAVNLKGIGEASRIYAQAHNGQWMVPAFDETRIGSFGIDWFLHTSGQGAVGYQREVGSDGLSSALSTTRALWMLVRSRHVPRAQFVCPSSEDVPDAGGDVELYHDFTQWSHVSYGYQVPFGPPNTRARENADPRQVFIADKGPFYNTYQARWGTASITSPPKDWKRVNSRNHRNGADQTATGEGQNCFFADGSVSFARIPAVGVDHDNIYTFLHFYDANGVIHGEPPHISYPPGYPGQGAPGDSTTDSLIYP